MGSPAVANGNVYFANTAPDGQLYAVSASDGSVIWQVDLGEEFIMGALSS
jgi:outer membrane protein assembly factor BamB